MRRANLLFTALLFCSALARPDRLLAQADFDLADRKVPAAPQETADKDSTPRFIRWMFRPTERGMSIRLPVMDTEPNRGVTGGVMPIWVLKGDGEDRIEQIHAPSLTYNKNFGFVPTYRFYYYPKQDANLESRASLSKYEKEVFSQYDDASIVGTPVDAHLRVHYNVDAGQRFFGLGPNSPKSGESNYKEDSWVMRLGGGLPLWPDSHVKAHFTEHYQTTRISDGPLPGLPGFSTVFPAQVSARHQQTNETRLTVDYDTRDSVVATSRGVLVQAFSEYAIRGYLSRYDYSRYGMDARYFQPWEGTPIPTATALRTRYEQILGDAPFWLEPRLGGKYFLRAYGAGRYVDRGMAIASVEQRIQVYKIAMAGVTTEIEVAPFAEIGSVFDNPERAARRYARPAFGSAVRAIARPQVVGSIDFGVGQEGTAIFMDVNYSF